MDWCLDLCYLLFGGGGLLYIYFWGGGWGWGWGVGVGVNCFGILRGQMLLKFFLKFLSKFF